MVKEELEVWHWALSRNSSLTQTTKISHQKSDIVREIPKADGRVMGRDRFPQANKNMTSSKHVLKLTPSGTFALIVGHGNKADKAKSHR